MNGRNIGSFVRVRPVELRDLEAIQAIYAYYVLNEVATFEVNPPSVVELVNRWASVTNSGLPYLVAEVNGEIAGYSYASSYRPRPAYRYTVEDSIFVRSDMRGRGIGRALLNELVVRCSKGPWRQMLAVIGGSGAGSIALHRSLGFVAVGELPAVGFKFGTWIGTALMQRAIGPGEASMPSDDVTLRI